MGCWSPVGDHTLQELNTMYLTRFRTYKIARPSQQKPRRGGGSQTDEISAAKSHYRSIFLDVAV